MKRLTEKIKRSGLLKSHIADKVGLSPSHLSMMLNNKATMPESTRYKINKIVDAVLIASV